MKRLLLGIVFGTLAGIALQRLGRQSILDARKPSSPVGSTSAETSPQARADEPTEADDDLSRLTAAELYRRAQAAGIPKRSQMTKEQLIEALRAADD